MTCGGAEVEITVRHRTFSVHFLHVSEQESIWSAYLSKHNASECAWFCLHWLRPTTAIKSPITNHFPPTSSHLTIWQHTIAVATSYKWPVLSAVMMRYK